MINPKILFEEKSDQLPSEAIEVLKILDELEDFTLKLKDQLLLELTPEEMSSIKLKLDHIL